MTFFPADTLNSIRTTYNSTLATPCSIWRLQLDSDGLSTGETIFIRNTMCAISMTGGGSSSPIINTLMTALSTKVPGMRVISFAWNEDVRTGDIVLERTFSTADPTMPADKSIPKYRLSVTNKDDPVRFGLQVTADPIRANKLE